MEVVTIPYTGCFSLSDTLKSGQLFHWEAFDLDGVPGFAGCIGNRPVSWIAQMGSGEVLTLARDQALVSTYFGLDQPMGEIHASFPQNDSVLASAIAYCPGIRVARQPLWECLATFITSSLKQVAHIRAISMTLRQRFGDPYQLGDRTFFAYPEPSALAEAGEVVLRECALGYRAKSLHRAALAVAEGGIDLSQIELEPDSASARAALMEMHGVGEKIANCALLFGAGRWDSFPIDVWIERILRQHYRKRVRGPKLQAWAQSYFGPNAGYAQQYLFHFARKTL